MKSKIPKKSLICRNPFKSESKAQEFVLVKLGKKLFFDLAKWAQIYKKKAVRPRMTARAPLAMVTRPAPLVDGGTYVGLVPLVDGEEVTEAGGGA